MPPPKKTASPKSTPVAAAPVPIVEKSEVKGSGTPKPAAAPAARTVTHDQIAKRAYEIYVSRSYKTGDPNADWTEAERQLKAGL